MTFLQISNKTVLNTANPQIISVISMSFYCNINEKEIWPMSHKIIPLRGAQLTIVHALNARRLNSVPGTIYDPLNHSQNRPLRNYLEVTRYLLTYKLSYKNKQTIKH